MDSKKCGICLSPDGNLRKIEYTWLEILKKISPEIEWYEFYKICPKCVRQIEEIRRFRETCIGKEPERQRDIISNITEYKIDNEIVVVKQELDQNQFYNENGADEDSESIDKHEIKSEIETINEPNSKEKSEKHQKAGRTKKTRITFKCPECESIFIHRQLFIDHCIEIHDIDKSEVRPYGCDQCPVRYKHHCNLRHHHERLHSERAIRHECPVCGETFNSKSTLYYHKKIHDKSAKAQTFECKDCGRVFNNRCSWKFHRLTVHMGRGAWDFQCEYCSKQFPMKSGLDEHVKRHKNERNFICEKCSRAFIARNDLTRHLLSHQEVKKFACEFCERGFNRKCRYDLHLTKVHNIPKRVESVVESNQSN